MVNISTSIHLSNGGLIKLEIFKTTLAISIKDKEHYENATIFLSREQLQIIKQNIEKFLATRKEIKFEVQKEEKDG